MSRLFIDGYEWVEADYMTVNKNLHVKGDFILDGGGSLAYDAIITGSIKVTGPTLGSFGSFTRITGWTDGIGTVKKTVGSFGVLAVGGQSRLHGALYGSLGSFSRVTIKGSAYGRTFYGSLGSFTRVPLVNVNIAGAAPALVKRLNGTATGNPLSLTVDGSWVYIADNNYGKIQKRKKSDFSYGTAYGSYIWEPSAIAIEHLTATGERGSYIYCAYENSGDLYPYQQGISKIRASDMTLTAQLKGTWPRGGGNYGTFLGNAKFYGIAIHGGSVYAADYNRVYKFNRGLTLGTVLISPTALGANYPTGLTTNGTNIFVSFGYQSNQMSIRRHDMLGSEIERITGLQNYPCNMAWSKGYLHLANANNLGLQRVEKYTIGPLAKVMDFPTLQPAFGLDADGSWYWVAEVSWAGGATRYIEQFTMGQGNIAGAGLVVTAGSFQTVIANQAKIYGTVTAKIGSFTQEVRAGTFRASKGSFITIRAGKVGIGTPPSSVYPLGVAGSAYIKRIGGTFYGHLGTPTKVFLPPLDININRFGVLGTWTGPTTTGYEPHYIFGMRGIKLTLGTLGATDFEGSYHRKVIWFPWLVPNDFRTGGTFIRITPMICTLAGPPKQGSISFQNLIYKFRNNIVTETLQQFGSFEDYTFVGLGRTGSKLTTHVCSHGGLVHRGNLLTRGDFALFRIGFGTYQKPLGSAYGYHSYGTTPFLVLGLQLEYNSRIQG